MLNIDEITNYFITVNYTEELKKQIYTSFSLFEQFGIQYYEDKYINLINRSDTIDNDTKRDTFILFLKQDLTAILNEHAIYLDNDQDVLLFDLNECVHFLYIIQNLEDYSLVSYIVHSNNPPKRIFISLMTQYTLLSEVRAMELIAIVEERFIDALKTLIESKPVLSEEQLNTEHLKYIQHFFNFTDTHTSLGLRLYKTGYTNLTLQELNNILTFNISDYVDKNIVTNLTQTALDVLSLLVITKDNYTVPLLKFNQNNGLFTHKLENVTKLETIITNILIDFNNYLEAETHKEKLNVH